MKLKLGLLAPFAILFGGLAQIRAQAVEVGGSIGREGAAFGEGVLSEYHPKLVSQLGVYGFWQRSAVNGYQQGGGITANFSDSTYGGGVDWRLRSIRRITPGAFFQLGRNVSNVVASYPDPMLGVVQYRSTDPELIWTPGVQVEYRIARTPLTVLGRVGKNFGNSFAAQTFGGVSIFVSIKADVTDLWHRIVR